ncbi:MAG: hypothetical protein M1820_007406 [Bogoriella megaspora]|nr:MAG: hypothetical protein M1820_007406 [Bogoriella megaspora]
MALVQLPQPAGITISSSPHISNSLIAGTTYFHDIQLSSTNSFSTKQITIPSGPFTGYQAIILIPTTNNLRPHLLNLPTELRLEIYRHLFNSTPTVTLSSTRPPTFQTDPPNYFSASNLAITNVCRQIRAEVLPVVYSERKFKVEASLIPDFVVSSFVNRLGDKKVLLRDVEIESYANSGWARPEMWRVLRECTGLRRVRVRVHAVSGEVEGYARFFAESAKVWLEEGRLKGGRCRALDMLEFCGLPEEWDGDGGAEKKLKECIQAFMGQKERKAVEDVLLATRDLAIR